MRLSVILLILFATTFLMLEAFYMPSPVQSGEVLYNGIELPSPWPPKNHTISQEPPATPSYLITPPKVIPIDVGRQLFVDDFLIEQTSLKRTFYTAEYYSVNPVVNPDKEWEKNGEFPCSMVFSDGAWYDPQDRQFKIWYLGGYQKGTCYATSKDGIHWTKPELDVVPGTNIVSQESRDSGTVWMDLEEKDPAKRFKMFLYIYPEVGARGLWLYSSPDGIHWSDRITRTGHSEDRSTVFYNPFRKVWVYGLRSSTPEVGRCRLYWENPDFLEGAKWQEGQPLLWVGADKLDPQRGDLKTPCQLYSLDCVAYESIMLGLFDIWRGQPMDRAKPNELVAGYSRDGFNWTRPDRRTFIPVSEKFGDWNWANVQSAGGCCLVVGDKLYFYVSARAGVSGTRGSGICTTALATLRRDGFASMDAGSEEGTLTTRPVRFSGKHLFVNADADEGRLCAEVIDESGKVIESFSRENCRPVKTDKTLEEISWNGGSDLASLAGKNVRFRFYLKNAKLFSFWVSPDRSGASRGYVAAGGPGFTGSTDTVGSAAYRSAAAASK